MYPETEIPLIIQKAYPSGPRYQIHHQGLQFLRNFTVKKIRTIFNISTDCNVEDNTISMFPEAFMIGNVSQESYISNSLFFKPSKQSEHKTSSCLTICKNVQIMGPDEIVIMLNAHQKTHTPIYLLFAYLISSVIIFHNDGQLTQKSDMVHVLSQFHEHLRLSNIKQILNAKGQKDNMKSSGILTGSDKKPYFVCAMHNDTTKSNLKQSSGNKARETFLGLFKNIGPNSPKQMKKAADAILQYLTNRTALHIPKNNKDLFIKDCLKLKNSLFNCLVKRKILEYQITGSTIQNLCLQLFQYFQSKSQIKNKQQKQLDFILICNQVISNQKQKIFTQSVDFYLKSLSSQVHTFQMPYTYEQLYEYHTKILKQTYNYLNQMSISCMTLQQYHSVRQNVQSKIEQTFLNLQIKNGKLSQQFNNDLKDSLQDGLELQDFEFIIDQINSKIDNFNYRSRGIEAKDKLCQLSKQLFLKFSNLGNRKLRTLQDNCLDFEIEISKLKLKIQKLQDNYRQLLKQYYIAVQNRQLSYKNLMNQQQPIVQKPPTIQQLQQNSSSALKIIELQKRLKVLQEQNLQKQVQIQDLKLHILDYQFRFSKQKIKPKSQIYNLTKQFSEYLKQFDTLFQKMEKIDDIVKQSKKQIQKEKQVIVKQRDLWYQQKQNLININKQFIQNQQKYKQSVVRSVETIELYKQIVQFTKNNLQTHAHQLINQKILITQLETNVLVYHKAIGFVCQTVKAKGIQGVLKNIKEIENQQLRQFVINILKKQKNS